MTNFYVLFNRTYVKVKATLAAKARKKKLKAAVVKGLLAKLNKVKDSQSDKLEVRGSGNTQILAGFYSKKQQKNDLEVIESVSSY